MVLTKENIIQIKRGYIEAQQELNDTILKMIPFCDSLKTENKKAYDYCFYGVLRRIFLIKKCLENFERITPPERNKYLDDEQRKDLNLFLHSFLLHISGGIDNLAWVWFYRRKIDKIEDPEKFRLKINLFNKQYKKYLDREVIDKCSEFKPWYNLLKNFRNPAAHRVPPYIIPYTVDPNDEELHRELENKLFSTSDKKERLRIQKQIDDLRDYEPVYMHSFIEESEMVRFHPQAISDSRSVCVLVNLIVKQLEKIKT